MSCITVCMHAPLMQILMSVPTLQPIIVQMLTMSFVVTQWAPLHVSADQAIAKLEMVEHV